MDHTGLQASSTFLPSQSAFPQHAQLTCQRQQHPGIGFLSQWKLDNNNGTAMGQRQQFRLLQTQNGSGLQQAIQAQCQPWQFRHQHPNFNSGNMMLQQQQQQNKHIPTAIIDLRTIAESMDRLPPSPGQPQKQALPFYATLMRLDAGLRFTIQNTMVLGFAPRPARYPEISYGKKFTPEATMFLDMLQAHQDLDPYKNYGTLVGLRCRFCCGSQEFVRGSCNFADIRRVPPAAAFQHAIMNRLQHLSRCPCVDDSVKEVLANQEKLLHSRKDQSMIETFMKQWSEIFVMSCYPGLMPATQIQLPPHVVPAMPAQAKTKATIAPLKATNNVPHTALKQPATKKVKTAEPSQADPILDTVFDGLEDTIAKTSQLTETLVFDEMPEESANFNSPSFAAFFHIYELQVSYFWKSNAREVILRCSKCRDAHQNLTTQFPLGGADWLIREEKRTRDIYDFVFSHTESCLCISPSSKRMLLRRVVPFELAHWKNFCQFWQKHLDHLFRSSDEIVKGLGINRMARLDVFRPITLEDMKEYGTLPWHSLPNADCFQMRCVGQDCSKDIVINNDLYRESIGNSWFRRTVSDYRGLFAEASKQQQDSMVEHLLDYIEQSGYSFLTIDHNGTSVAVSRVQGLAYVHNALTKGFPEMLRPPMDPKLEKKVFDLEIPPWVGRVHGDILWPEKGDPRNNLALSKRELPIIHKRLAKMTKTSVRRFTRRSASEFVQAVDAYHSGAVTKSFYRGRRPVMAALGSSSESTTGLSSSKEAKTADRKGDGYINEVSGVPTQPNISPLTASRKNTPLKEFPITQKMPAGSVQASAPGSKTKTASSCLPPDQKAAPVPCGKYNDSSVDVSKGTVGACRQNARLNDSNESAPQAHSAFVKSSALRTVANDGLTVDLATDVSVPAACENKTPAGSNGINKKQDRISSEAAHFAETANAVQPIYGRESNAQTVQSPAEHTTNHDKDNNSSAERKDSRMNDAMKTGAPKSEMDRTTAEGKVTVPGSNRGYDSSSDSTWSSVPPVGMKSRSKEKKEEAIKDSTGGTRQSALCFDDSTDSEPDEFFCAGRKRKAIVHASAPASKSLGPPHSYRASKPDEHNASKQAASPKLTEQLGDRGSNSKNVEGKPSPTIVLGEEV